MPFTAEELEAMRIADEEIDREYEVSSTDTEISKWLDELAINDRLDHKQLHNKRYQRAYREEHKDKIAAQRRAYYEEHKDEIAAQRRAYRARKKNTAPDTAMSESGM